MPQGPSGSSCQAPTPYRSVPTSSETAQQAMVVSTSTQRVVIGGNGRTRLVAQPPPFVRPAPVTTPTVAGSSGHYYYPYPTLAPWSPWSTNVPQAGPSWAIHHPLTPQTPVQYQYSHYSSYLYMNSPIYQAPFHPPTLPALSQPNFHPHNASGPSTNSIPYASGEGGLLEGNNGESAGLNVPGAGEVGSALESGGGWS
ncbi:hypothetical protein BDV93DRAFT_512175 [Ceratobasidium sp. AG-I]|nr:hypothetical protein BDV93DRAFT_512175 [Ceratobasidium sp. AG-I]